MTAPVETGKVSVSLQRLRYLERDSEECGELKRQLSEVKRERDLFRSRFTRKIVCLCGSTRFYRAFRDFNKRLTLQGIIVLTIGCDTCSDDDLFGHLSEAERATIKAMLDELHKCKIDLADEVLVLDVNGYIGSSTKSEIEYAKSRGKSIRYLSREFPGYREPVDSKGGLEERDSLKQQLAERDAALAEKQHLLERMVDIAAEELTETLCPYIRKFNSHECDWWNRPNKVGCCQECIRDYLDKRAKEGEKDA